MKVLGEVGTDVLVDEIKKIRQSVKTNSEKLELISPNYIEGTYAEIKALMESGQLYPGAKYLIKDHKLHYNAKNIELLTDNTYEILLTANTPDSFGIQVQWRIVGENIWQNASYSFEAKIYGTDVEYLDKEHTGVMWDISYDGKQYPFMPDAFAINIPQQTNTIRFNNHKTSATYGRGYWWDSVVHPLKDGKYLHIGKLDDANYGHCVFISINDNPGVERRDIVMKFGEYDNCIWLMPDGKNYCYFDYEVHGTQMTVKQIILISKDLQTIDERAQLFSTKELRKIIAGDTYEVDGVTYDHAGYTNDSIVVRDGDAYKVIENDDNYTKGLKHDDRFAIALTRAAYTDDASHPNIFNLNNVDISWNDVSSGFFDTESNQHILCNIDYVSAWTGREGRRYIKFHDSDIYGGKIKYKGNKFFDDYTDKDITDLIIEKLSQPNIIKLEWSDYVDMSCFNDFPTYEGLINAVSPAATMAELTVQEVSTVDQILPVVFEGYPMPPKRTVLGTDDEPNYIIPVITHHSASEISAPLVLGTYSDRMSLSQARFRSKNKKYLSGTFTAKHLTSMFEGVQADDDSICLSPGNLSEAAATADDSIHITQRDGVVIVKYEVNGEPKIETFK